MFFSFARQPTRDEEEARTQQQFQDNPVRSIDVPAPSLGVSLAAEVAQTRPQSPGILNYYFLKEVVDKMRQMLCTDECYLQVPKFLRCEPALMLQTRLPTNRVVVKL